MKDDSYPRDYARAVRYTADGEDDPVLPCPNCGETAHDGLVPDANDDGAVGCSACTQVCDHCNRPQFTSGFESVGRYRPGRPRPMVCASCLDGDDFGTCADCEQRFNTDDLNGTNTSNYPVCGRCDEDYFNCADCDGRFHSDDYAGDGLCNDCADRESDLIHDYDHSPNDLNFHGDGRHYGVELETVLKHGNLNDAAEDTLTALNEGYGPEGFAYLKKDGSLHGGVGSFEIVTHPATLDVHKQQWDNFLGSKAPRGLVSHDTDCCGLHIHVEKAGLSDLTVGKILSFVNARNNRDFVEAVARRSSDRYAKLDPTKKPQDAVKRNNSRYEAVNLQNDDTIEFRIFKGTLKPESFYRSLEFVDAVVEYARPATASLKSMVGVDGFFEFVAANRDRYPNLFPFCEKFAGRELARKPNPKKFARSEPVKMSVRLVYKER